MRLSWATATAVTHARGGTRGALARSDASAKAANRTAGSRAGGVRRGLRGGGGGGRAVGELPAGRAARVDVAQQGRRLLQAVAQAHHADDQLGQRREGEAVGQLDPAAALGGG